MDRQSSEYIIESFLALENHVIDFSKYIPFNDRNSDIELPLLINVILECGSIIDSIFRVEFRNPTKSPSKLNMSDYALHYEIRLGLSQKKTLLYIYPPRYFKPFENWITNNQQYNPLLWWQNHNKIKHNRIKNVSLSTLGIAFEMLSAIHQLISFLPTFVDSLFSHNLVAYDSLGINDVKRNYFDLGRRDTQMNSVLVESVLFATPVGGYLFHDNPNDIDLESIVDSTKLNRFLGRDFNTL